jgi:alpha-galactosidase
MSQYLRLNGHRSCIVFNADQNKFPEIVYWGTKLQETISKSEGVFSVKKPVLLAGMNELYPVSILPLCSKGFWGAPAMEGNRLGKDWSPDFQLEKTTQDKNRIIFEFNAKAAELALSIQFYLDTETDVLESKTCLSNLSDTPFQLDWLSAGTFPIQPKIDKVISFNGNWSNEFQIQTHSLRAHCFIQENRRGRTSHSDFPGILLEENHTIEQQGLSYGFHLAWSGNHKILVEPINQGEAQIQLGELFASGECILKKGETYQTPSVYASYSGKGRTQLSQNFHQFLRKNIFSDLVKSQERPVQLNTWEAVYFDHDLPTLTKMASKAAELGFERFVLDDGWFEGRNDDTAALGDWVPDKLKYPDGLDPLINHVLESGMVFGLWVEPEMVSPNSQLYQKHPDWVLHLNHQTRATGRNQLVLNLNKPEVFDFLFNRFDKILKDHDISYLKWDMNRDLTQAGDGDYAKYHHQVIALYQLIDLLRKNHPDVEIETCASGGARIDFEILKRTDRFWTSDNNDALKRISIQRGCSYFFPLEVMGSHIGPENCHITERHSRLNFRAHTALFGHFGAEFDITNLNKEEQQELGFWINFYKQKRSLLHQGNLVRIDTTDPTRTIQGVVSRDKNEALFVIYQTDVPSPKSPAQVYFKGLNPTQKYCVKLVGCNTNDPAFEFIPNLDQWLNQGFTMLGEELEHIGLWLQLPLPETSLILYLNQ